MTVNTSAAASRELAEAKRLIEEWRKALSILESHRPFAEGMARDLNAAVERLAAQPAAPAVLAEPVAHVVEPHPSGANYLAWYSNKAMFNTPAGTKLFDHPASQARSPTPQQLLAAHGYLRSQEIEIAGHELDSLLAIFGIGSATTEAKSHE